MTIARWSWRSQREACYRLFEDAVEASYTGFSFASHERLNKDVQDA
jgi:hypothetical protein